jgi:hypothetical protein
VPLNEHPAGNIEEPVSVPLAVISTSKSIPCMTLKVHPPVIFARFAAVLKLYCEVVNGTLVNVVVEAPEANEPFKLTPGLNDALSEPDPTVPVIEKSFKVGAEKLPLLNVPSPSKNPIATNSPFEESP